MKYYIFSRSSSIFSNTLLCSSLVCEHTSRSKTDSRLRKERRRFLGAEARIFPRGQQRRIAAVNMVRRNRREQVTKAQFSHRPEGHVLINPVLRHI